MAATDGAARAANALQALSSAALLLPGILAPAHVRAQDAPVEEFSFQFDHFEEGRRDLIDVRSDLDPIQVDVVHGSLNAILSDRLNLRLNYSQDSWSGATPFTTAPLAANGNRAILRDTPNGVIQSGASPYANNRVLLDSARRPYVSALGGPDTRVVHILSSASPEIRQQGDLSFAYEWQDAGLEVGAGVSDEPDFYSRFGNAALRFDFRQKTTTLKFGVAYTDNDIHAILDSDVVPYLTRNAYADRITRRDGEEILGAGSHEWTWHAGVTQVLNRQSLMDFSVGWTQSRGFLASPYKATAVLFVDPMLAQAAGATGLVAGDMRVLMEQRPDTREQWAFSSRYVHYVEALDAALHLNYQFASDSWGMRANTFVAQWVQPLGAWTLTPRLRYYSQNAVSFYTPYMVSEQAYRRVSFEDGEPIIQNFDPALLPRYFSSDHRLAGFGGVSGSLTLSRELTRGLSFEASVESYKRDSSLQLDGSGSGAYADMDFTVVSAGVKLDFAGARTRAERRDRESMTAQGEHDHSGMSMPMSAGAHEHGLPPGLMFAHTLPRAGDVMMAYHYQSMLQSGAMIDAHGRVSDADIVSEACLPEACRYVPREMSMRMHMLDLMYAPTDRLTLMLMPQLMSMEMHFRELDGRPPVTPGEHEHANSGGHRSGGFGDTVVAAIAKLPFSAGGQWHAGLGLSLPTGKVDLELRRMFKTDGGLMHFDMQTGSGTWDLLPSVTYTGMGAHLNWGAQWSAIARLGGRNDSGYRLGNQQQLNGWLSYPVSHALSLTLRSTYTWRGKVEGDFNAYSARLGPMDFPFNQGGRLLEAGIGASYTIPATSLGGSQLSLEWVAPVHDAPYGVQLARKPVLNASWQYHF